MSRNKFSPWPIIFLAIQLLCVSCLPSGPRAEYQIEIVGAENRAMSGGQLFFEKTQNRNQIWIQEPGSGGDLKVIDIKLPEILRTGTYQITSQGPVTFAYSETVNNVSRIFWEDERGTITLFIDENGLSGSFELTIYELLLSNAPDPGAGKREYINLKGEIWNLPYQQPDPNDPSRISPVIDQTASDQTVNDLAGLGINYFFWGLILVNFVFQFYVGSRVYADQGIPWLRSLRGTATFIRGWQTPELRHTMILWSIILAFLALYLFGALILSKILG